jgi:hypothetical protein
MTIRACFAAVVLLAAPNHRVGRTQFPPGTSVGDPVAE